MILSILIAVYNERTVVAKSLSLVLAAPLPENMKRALAVVADCSTDGTGPILQTLATYDARIRLSRPEITMKSSKRKLRVYEVPISYHGRSYEEGKKIGWQDGVKALGVILYFWMVDDLYEASYGRGLLNSLTGTPQYLSWLTRVVRPHLGDTV